MAAAQELHTAAAPLDEHNRCRSATAGAIADGRARRNVTYKLLVRRPHSGGRVGKVRYRADATSVLAVDAKLAQVMEIASTLLTRRLII